MLIFLRLVGRSTLHYLVIRAISAALVAQPVVGAPVLSASVIISGTVLAAQRAHSSLFPGSLSLGNTSIVNGNINRSPSAYLANPEEERARYEFDLDQDKEFTLLRFEDESGAARGILSFFAVHGTSLYENNTLVSGDNINKGMAAWHAGGIHRRAWNPVLLFLLGTRERTA